MKETVAALVETTVRVFSPKETGNDLHRYFEENPASNGIVVMGDDGVPTGLVMKPHFYQMIGTQFGFSIYMNRSVELLMKRQILCLDIEMDLAQFGFQAMNRQDNDVYDFVLIMKQGVFCGIVSISNFLMAMSEMKQRQIELLNSQQQILEQAHAQEKALRREIEIKNRSIKKLLDNADQGFLSFHQDLIIYEEHSSVCDDIFAREVAGLHFGRLMEAYLDEKQHGLLIHTLNSLFSQKKKARAKVFLSLLPGEFRSGNRHINIRYKLISFEESRILMVILTDITDKKALEKKQDQEKNNMKLILSAIHGRADIRDAVADARRFFSQEAAAFFEQDRPVQEVLSDVFRVVHTMKGDFALRQMHNTALNLHRIEDRLSLMMERPKEQSGCRLKNFWDTIGFDRIIQEDLAVIQDFLGDTFLESDTRININYKRLEALIEAVEERFTGGDRQFLVHHIKELTYPSLNGILSGYSDYIQILALKLGKSIEEFKVTGDTVYINRSRYANFLKTIIHIFRNIVDHGIELPENRAEKGKEETGRIQCEIRKQDAHFILTISDDGKGIDPEHIARLAVGKGIYTQARVLTLSRAEIINTIFMDSFSTKQQVSMLSGRGVGLAAVRSEIEALGGSIEVDTVPDEGTSFTIVLPDMD